MFGLFGKKNGSEPPVEPEVLLEEVNPHGTLQAVVEANHSTVYLYLAGPEDSGFGMRSLWIRNLASAPEKPGAEAMKRGEPPMNPAEYCSDPAGSSAPNASDLRLVWLPESNGVALYEADRVIGIIPPWSGQGGFFGYADAAVGTGPLAWALERDNVLFDQFREAQAFWAQWDEENQWGRIQDDLLDGYERTCGAHSNYYALDEGTWPPKALVRIPRDDAEILLTLGVSICPQPNVESESGDRKALRRIELGTVVPLSWENTAVEAFARYMSGLSGYPWARFTWLGAGHTTDCDVWRDKSYTSSLLWPNHPAVQHVRLNPQFGDPTRVLWILPITDKERKLASRRGAEVLVNQLPPERWKQA